MSGIEEDAITVYEKDLNYRGPDRMAHYLEFIRETENEKKVDNFTTGLANLDMAFDGFETGEVTVISGPTGNGKTLLADSICQRLMRFSKANVAFFSFEVPTRKLIEKYLTASDSTSLGLYVPMELKAGDMDWIINKCREVKAKYDCKAVIIDHLHFLVDMGTKQNMSLNIGGVMRTFKHSIAKAMDLMVFVLAHQGQPREDAEPSIDNIRDSSFIGQESDNVLIVYRTSDPIPEELKENAKIKGYPRTYDSGFCTVKVEKARRAGTFRKKLKYQKQGHWLEEVLW